jgi:hypothetical protein
MASECIQAALASVPMPEAARTAALIRSRAWVMRGQRNQTIARAAAKARGRNPRERAWRTSRQKRD